MVNSVQSIIPFQYFLVISIWSGGWGWWKFFGSEQKKIILVTISNKLGVCVRLCFSGKSFTNGFSFGFGFFWWADVMNDLIEGCCATSLFFSFLFFRVWFNQARATFNLNVDLLSNQAKLKWKPGWFSFFSKRFFLFNCFGLVGWFERLVL